MGLLSCCTPCVTIPCTTIALWLLGIITVCAIITTVFTILQFIRLGGIHRTTRIISEEETTNN